MELRKQHTARCTLLVYRPTAASCTSAAQPLGLSPHLAAERYRLGHRGSERERGYQKRKGGGERGAARARGSSSKQHLPEHTRVQEQAVGKKGNGLGIESQTQPLRMSTTENPVASVDAKVDTVLASFEDESAAAASGKASAFETEGGLEMFSSKSQMADHSKLSSGSKVGCCVRFFMGDNSAGHVASDQMTDSVVEFDPIPLAEDQLYSPSLIDIGGYELSAEADVEIIPEEIPDVDEEIKSGDLVWIRDEVHKRPLAIGRALLEGKELKTELKGKGIKTLHWVGDDLWALE